MREIVMPKSSMTMTEGELIRWVKAEGEEVAEGDVVAEIMTDKVEMEVEAPSDGRLGILVDEGATVPVGVPIAVVLAEGEAKPSAPAGGPVTAPGAAAPPDSGTEPQSHAHATASSDAAKPAAGGAGPPGSTPHSSRPPASPAGPSGAGRTPATEESSVGTADGRLRATPAARAMAKRVGIDLGQVRGTGPRGRIKSADVAALASRRAPEAPPPAGDLVVASRVKPRGIRGAMARHMSVAATIPQFTLFADVTMAAADGARRERDGISLTDVIVHAVALALRDHGELNAHFVDGEIVTYETINVGLAADTPQGLVVPVIKGADAGLDHIAAQRKELAEAARIGRLRPDEVEGGTFTVTNLGMFGIDVFQPVVDPPRVGILSVGRMRGDAGKTSTLGLACDHRAVDGAQGARFVQTVTRLLERPDRYLF